MRAELTAALDRFDEAGAHAAFDRLLSVATVDTLLSAVVLPYLQELGERWTRGEASVAQEHFASVLLRGRLLGLARGWGAGTGPVALLACVPGEDHDLGLIAFGLALRALGWRIVFLGSDSPIATVGEAAAAVGPDLIVLSAVSRARFDRCADELSELARHHRVAIGGAGAGSAEGLEPAVCLRGALVEEAAAAAALQARAR
jgi:methanogenic corrinoid protein MtbC1